MKQAKQYYIINNIAYINFLLLHYSYQIICICKIIFILIYIQIIIIIIIIVVNWK